VREDGAQVIPELVRRIELTTCAVDPPGAIVAVLARMVAEGIALSDVLADCGYSMRVPEKFALPVRALPTFLVMDLHPADRGEKGTHAGAVICNGALYCPATPPSLFKLAPLPRGASQADLEALDASSGELSRYKLGVNSSEDADGYVRLSCPAVLGKVRCALRPLSLSFSFEHPSIPEPPKANSPPAVASERSRYRHLLARRHASAMTTPLPRTAALMAAERLRNGPSPQARTRPGSP